MILSIAACAEAEAPPEEVVRPVRTVTVVGTGAGRSRSFSGTAQAGMTSNLSFRVTGTVEDLRVEVGDTVDKGQVIARIDSTDFLLQLQEARAALLQARAQERSARAQYDRTRALYENNNASKADLDQARSAAETGQAQVRSAEKRRQLAQRQLDYTVLVAPEPGSIAAVMAEVNENVSSGQSVVTLTAGARAEVKVSVPEILIRQIHENMKVDVTFDAIEGTAFEGIVSEVGVAPEARTTTFPVIVQLAKDYPEVRPGMAAEVSIQFENTSDRVRFLLPPEAVGEDNQGNFVFVAQSTEPGFGTVQRRSVEVGDLTTEGIEVLAGLEDGDRVVTAGVSRIQDGQRVRLPAG
jgi:RND family efflux transporter MFP subunit